VSLFDDEVPDAVADDLIGLQELDPARHRAAQEEVVL
jgi:hypothetical protein